MASQLNLSKARYAAAQSARVAWYMAHYSLTRNLVRGRPKAAQDSEAETAGRQTEGFARSEDAEAARKHFFKAFEQDLQNIEDGLYPPPRDVSVRDALRTLESSRLYLKDAWEVDARRRRKGGREVPQRPNSAPNLPAYYLQNFHFQSGGWLSEESARLYDTQVEVLFTGAADVMRRAALAEIGRELRGKDQRKVRYLEAACGSGRFLRQTLDAFPRLNAEAFDLSPSYCEAAREAVRDWPHAKISTADVTAMPFADGEFDIIGNIYLFHELPPIVRRQAVAELARVIKPGGMFVFADSVQVKDAPAFSDSIEHFPDLFHEPYYRSYLRTDLEALFAESGFAAERETVSFLTKVIAFRRS
jgi:ubiquinone/menaquinone biosynthesis C-methylase UbiE